MSFLWTNSTKSGLCDRLIDLFIVASTAKLYNRELYLYWEEQPIDHIQKNIWNKIRFHDYKIENVSQYFIFPDTIHIISKETLYNFHLSDDDILFNRYLGGVYSPITFYENFIDKKYTLIQYLDIFKNMIHAFKPTDKLLNLVKDVPENIVSVHLRRTDKTSIYVSSVKSNGIPLSELNNLNNNTKDIINLISKENRNLYFSSDCPSTKIEYEKYYKDYNIINFDVNSIEKTYVDIYVMSISKFIIMSQKHTSFSLFASLINQTNLICLYKNCIIHDNKYDKYYNIIYYKDYINSLETLTLS